MAALGAAGLLAVGAAAPSAAATGPAPCGTSFNPYDYSAAADRACGDTVTPLTGVTSAMGGGKTYTYTAADGETSQEHVLPPNFDGLTASAAELAAYDLPARPTGLNQLAQWAQELAHIKLASPPPFLAQTPNPVTPAPASSEVFPYPWSGYASVYKKDGTTRLPLGTYSYITMAFIEPSYNNDVCPNGEAYIWSGLGGIGSTALPQTGTAHNVNNLGNHQAWYVLEINNQQGAIPYSPSFSVAAGDTVEAIVQKFSGGYEFEVYDVTTSTEAAMSVSSTVATGDSAEAVAEDVQENQYELADFGPSGFQVNSVNTNRNQLPNGLAGDNPTPLVLKNNYGNGSTVLAQPGAISGDGTFTDQWKSCTPGNQ